MRLLPLVLSFSSVFCFQARSLAQSSPPSASTRRASICHPVTVAMLKAPLALTESCYTVNQSGQVQFPLTVSPGTTVLFGEGSLLSIENNGSLEALGTAEKPIIFKGRDHTPGFWGGFTFFSHSSHNHLSYVTIDGAGSRGRDTAAVLLASGSQMSMDHTTIRGALGSGLTLYDHAAFEHFAANHFEDNGVPLTIKASDAAMIDPETTFSGNKDDVVLIQSGNSVVAEDSVWRQLPVPYLIDGSVSLEARLQIEPGTTLQFKEGGAIDVTFHGALTAIGTAVKPIVLTGTEESPGFWGGINFEVPSAQNILRHVEIRFAGARSGPTGSAVGIWADASATVQDSTISSCPIAILVQRGGTLNSDAASSNVFPNAGRTIVAE